MRYRFGGLIFGGAYTWRGLFSEFYGNFVSSPICDTCTGARNIDTGTKSPFVISKNVFNNAFFYCNLSLGNQAEIYNEIDLPLR